MSKKIIRKSKTVKTDKAQPGSLHPACCAATLNIEEIFATLKAAEMFIAVHKPTPYSETCECGSCRIIRSLKNVRKIMRHNDQAKNRNLMKLIWAIVLKHGGETRLSDFERGIMRDDWELLEYTDMETLELVIKARSAPNAALSQAATTQKDQHAK